MNIDGTGLDIRLGRNLALSVRFDAILTNGNSMMMFALISFLKVKV